MAGPQTESPARRVARCRVAALAAAPGSGKYAAGKSVVRLGRHADSCVLSADRHRFAAVCDGKRRFYRDCHRRQRGIGRHLTVHGRRQAAAEAVCGVTRPYSLLCALTHGNLDSLRADSLHGAELHLKGFFLLPYFRCSPQDTIDIYA